MNLYTQASDLPFDLSTGEFTSESFKCLSKSGHCTISVSYTDLEGTATAVIETSVDNTTFVEYDLSDTILATGSDSMQWLLDATAGSYFRIKITGAVLTGNVTAVKFNT